MQAMAKITSKGQITIPKAVREELGLEKGGWVVFRILGSELAEMERVPNFIELAGSVPVPPEKRGVPWEEIREATWRARAEELHEKAMRTEQELRAEKEQER
ncbi:MAG: type II toxin-antitoxin system PrlF family antitoxin [Actinomycetota bacterium]|nr:type II toxin-antitoxin system PrlF family antitoxin [Actinomycetota bacterium]